MGTTSAAGSVRSALEREPRSSAERTSAMILWKALTASHPDRTWPGPATRPRPARAIGAREARRRERSEAHQYSHRARMACEAGEARKAGAGPARIAGPLYGRRRALVRFPSQVQQDTRDVDLDGADVAAGAT